ncbi:uncharacterized protein I206_101385 [Kwoniella pini CBS 10737]|uniref:Cytoplasmic protein n=1 Tax=Kwoniella pini CBS 10737 TaxID=1296096 RepID=A0A1B9HWV3_9TREE|nr:uncharacterized protein I206_06645 [Kwoniella pini CBS 10737]OCF47739.1 hypothetical protein I206_06645 [Kwoniella pini CBS 10737]
MPSEMFVESDDNPPIVVPPINFSLVVPGIYRSGHPNKKNFNFLKKLNFKTIIYLENENENEKEQEKYRKDFLNFINININDENENENKIIIKRFDLSKESNLFTLNGLNKLNELLKIILNFKNYPILLHDDNGKGTVSLICALIRKIQNWSLTSIFSEGDLFAGPASGSEGVGLGEAGMEFIASFEPKKVVFDKKYKPDWVD